MLDFLTLVVSGEIEIFARDHVGTREYNGGCHVLQLTVWGKSPGNKTEGENKFPLQYNIRTAVLVSVADRLWVLDLRQKDDDKDDGEGPRGEKPEDRELPPDGGVVSHYGEHVEPFYWNSQHREESGDNGNNEESIEEFKVIAALLDDGWN